MKNQPLHPQTNKLGLPLLFIGIILFFSSSVSSQSVANFTANIITGCAPIVVNFKDQSSGAPTEWKWDMGNGTVSNLQNPSNTYFNPGTFTVKLIITVGNKKDSVIKTNYIIVNGPPFANFKADVTTGCSPLLVNFTDISNTANGSINSKQWDFGDGIISTLQNPSHSYINSGSYNVTLKVTNSNGCTSAMTKSAYIKNNYIAAGFTNKIMTTCSPNKITFQNTTIGNGIINVKWDFGDNSTSTLDAPTHTYINGGNYTVKIFASNQYGCVDSLIKNITVNDPVSAVFTSDNLENCTGPVKVHFSNTDLAGNNYFWNFGDSTFSSLSNPTHIFKDTGNYTINLVVKNINGCVDSSKKINYIKIYKPVFAFNNLPDSGCIGFTKKISLQRNAPTLIKEFHWDFGDGTTSTDSMPTHTFNKIGYYNVALIYTSVNGCSDTLYMPNAINVSPGSVANFSADKRICCSSTQINFKNLSTGATAWQWYFGDNKISFDKDPLHTYADTGYMHVTLISSNGGCYDTATYTDYIYLKPAVARFLASMDCKFPYVRKFLNNSKGFTRLLWDFGDGTTSVEISPTHTFPGTGDFLVSLQVWNDSTGCTSLYKKTMKVQVVTPVFTASKTVICKGDIVNFSAPFDASEVGIFSWNFGDGSKEFFTTQNTVAHTYLKKGVFTVHMVTYSIVGCADTIVKKEFIHVNSPGAKFNVSDKVACVNSSVFFLDSSLAEINPLQSWIWKYGDGVIDTVTNSSAQHVFKNAGNYSVSLKLIDSQGCTDAITLQPALQIIKPNAKFFVKDSVACPNYPVEFTCPYNVPGISYLWDFGDGATAKTQSPKHIYSTEGVYNVKLYLNHSNGCTDSSLIPNAVRIAQTIANFTISDSFGICPPLLVQFTNHSLNAISEYWNFGDSSFTTLHNPSHFYTYPGVYTATLYAKGPGGCVATMQRQITVKGPKGYMVYTPVKQCKPYIVNFQVHSDDAKNYLWDFNDGNIITNADSVMVHIYKDSGNFLPKIILIDTLGCRVPVSGKDTITNVFATANFTFPDNVLCTESDLIFTNTSYTNDVITSYYWDFGDNKNSNQKNPVHQYAAPGFYYPTLTINTRNGCSGYYRSLIPVKVVPSSALNIAAVTKGCVPFTTSFFPTQNETDASFIQWHWNMGNGNTYDLENPPKQSYNTSGTYTINLSAINANGCLRVVSKMIDVYPQPSVQVSHDTLLCKGQQVDLKVTGQENYKYKWEPSLGLNCDTCELIKATPLVSTKYSVTSTSLQGCHTSADISIQVKQPFKIIHTQADKLCIGQSKHLEVSGASTYQWSPAIGLSTVSGALITAKPDTTTNYRVIGTDEKGCFNDTGYVKLTVYPIPTVNAGGDKIINVGQVVTIKPAISEDVSEVIWSPKTWVISSDNDLPDITVKPKEKTDYTVEVKNKGGCKASDNVTVSVICNGTNVFMPNVFSPNNDGVNDLFYPRGSGLYKIKNLRIFSRWGEIIFEKNNFNSNDPSAAWDGTFKGSKLNSETYIYTMEVICDNNNVINLNGTIALIK